MNEFWIKVIINIVVGVVVILGFLTFWGRSSGWFIEGGFVYEYLKSRKNKKRQLKQQKKRTK